MVGMEAVRNVFTKVKYQQCNVHFYRTIILLTPHSKVKTVSNMLNAQETKKADREKAKAVLEELRSIRLKKGQESCRMALRKC